MSQSYSYDIAADTPNGKINPDIFHQELLDAALGSGGTLENVETDNGTDLGNGVVQGGTLKITWQNALSGADEAAQDAVVAATQGVAFGPNVQRAQDNNVKSTSNGGGSPELQVELIPQPLPAGQYLFTLYCEIRLQADVAGSGVRAEGLFNGSPAAQDNWDLSVWHAFSGSAIKSVKAGETPTIAIEFWRIGSANTVECRSGRLSISQQSG